MTQGVEFNRLMLQMRTMQMEAMGKPQYLTEAQLATLHAASEPAASVVDVPADGALALTLPPYGVAHLKVISCG